MAVQAWAEDFKIDLPVDCTIGETCWLVNLVDVDPSKAAEDFRCRGRAYDGHKGTDFGIENTAAIKRNFAVRAAAAGRVLGTRNDMPDSGIDETGPGPEIAGRECGNGLVIDHGSGWVTQYCHLRKGSLQVRPGDLVARGQVLGAIGQSGLAQFPHLHLSLRKDDVHIDPFTGKPMGTGCDINGEPIWSESALAQLPDQVTAIYHMGFAGQEPAMRDVRAGRFGSLRLPANAPAIVAFAEIYWVEAGDKVNFQIFGPNGQVFTQLEIVLEKRQARRTQFIGRRLRTEMSSWPPGPYRAVIKLERKAGVSGDAPLHLERRVTAVIE